jgi:hypothetical protein
MDVSSATAAAEGALAMRTAEGAIDLRDPTVPLVSGWL